jgi:hypothetical protein
VLRMEFSTEKKIKTLYSLSSFGYAFYLLSKSVATLSLSLIPIQFLESSPTRSDGNVKKKIDAYISLHI